MSFGKKIDSKIHLSSLALRKIAILEEEKQNCFLLRQKDKEVATRVISRVGEVVKDAILELERQEEATLVTNSI